MLLRSDYFTSFCASSVTLPSLEIELGQDSNLVVSIDAGNTFVPLGETAFEQLLGYLGAPVGFAKKLRKAGRGHVLSYLHKQLAQTVGEASYLAIVHPKEGVVGLCEKQTLFFLGQEARDLDRKIEEWVSTPSCPMTLRSCRADEGAVRYFFLFKETAVVPEDSGSSWAWGYELRYSLWGKEPASFHVAVDRKISQSLTYIPETKYHYPLNYDANVNHRIESVLTFLNSAPEPNWKELGRLVQRLRREQASLAEVKTVRKKLASFLKGQEGDNSEGKQRVDSALDWKNIEDAYGLKELDEKPSLQWFKRASTPVNLFDLFSLLSQEVTYAPNSVSPEAREKLLTLAGELLCSKPDLEDFPPRIDWGQRRFEQKTQLA